MSVFDSTAAAGGSVIDPIAATIKNPFSQSVNNGQRQADFPRGFQIIEYVNGAPNPSTKLSLVGNMMPMRPFPWEGEQHLVRHYYPGNPEVSVHVMGPREGDLIIRGRFKDKRYKTNQYYGVSYQYSLAIDAMRKRGNLIKFGMFGAYGSWFRYGFIEHVSFKMDRLSWVDYEIRFLVISETQPKNNYFAAPEKQAPSAVNQNLINQAAAFNSTYSTVPTSMPLSIAGALNNLISGIAKNINLVTGFVSTIISTAQSIEDSANRALGLIQNARASLSMFRRQIDNLEHGFASLSTQGSPAGQARDTYANVQYIMETASASVALSQYLAQMQSQFAALARTVPKARYKVQSGDTLQNISIKFYGVADNWTDIYDHNQLQTTALTPGTILEIPNV